MEICFASKPRRALPVLGRRVFKLATAENGPPMEFDNLYRFLRPAWPPEIRGKKSLFALRGRAVYALMADPSLQVAP